MANEANIREKFSNPINMTVADGTGIEKGAVLQLTDPRTASASSATGEKFAGIAAMEKVASDGHTQLAVHYDGIFDMTMATNSTCSAGDLVIISGANTIARASDYATAAHLYQSGLIIGKALEDGSSAEVIQVLVGAV